MAVSRVVVVDDRNLKRAFRTIEKSLQGNGRRKLFARIARKLRDLTRRRITTQGDGSWKPLSRWTKERTGRRKALLPLRKNIKAKWNNNEATVVFERTSPDWDATTHHQGATSPAVKGKRMTFLLANGKRRTFFNRKASVIPARRIWLSQKMTRIQVNRILRDYTKEIEVDINGIS